jgi:hypothetical protein
MMCCMQDILPQLASIWAIQPPILCSSRIVISSSTSYMEHPRFKSQPNYSEVSTDFPDIFQANADTLCDVMLFSLVVDIYQHFHGTYCLHLLGWRVHHAAWYDVNVNICYVLKQHAKSLNCLKHDISHLNQKDPSFLNCENTGKKRTCFHAGG